MFFLSPGEDVGKVRRLTPDRGQPAGEGSWSAMDVDPRSGLIVASWSDCVTPPELYVRFAVTDHNCFLLLTLV